MKLSVIHGGHSVNGTIDGHKFLLHKNHASSGAAIVSIPVVQKNIPRLTNKSSNAAKLAIRSANMKGSV